MPEQAGAMVTISGDLITHVRSLFPASLRLMAGGTRLRVGNNGYSELALPAYVVSVASVEAFVNEAFLAPTTGMMLDGSPLWQLRSEWLEEVDLREKMILVAHLLFEHQMDRGRQPLQDFHTLVRIRNDIVHYKMDLRVPSFLASLAQRGITAPWPRPREGVTTSLQPWVSSVSSVEGIRWAHNVACRMVAELVRMIPATQEEHDRRGLGRVGTWGQYDFTRSMAAGMGENFREITDAESSELWRQMVDTGKPSAASDGSVSA